MAHESGREKDGYASPFVPSHRPVGFRKSATWFSACFNCAKMAGLFVMVKAPCHDNVPNPVFSAVGIASKCNLCASNHEESLCASLGYNSAKVSKGVAATEYNKSQVLNEVLSEICWGCVETDRKGLEDESRTWRWDGVRRIVVCWYN